MEEKFLERIIEIAEEKYPRTFVRKKVEKLLEKVDYLIDYYPEADKNCVKAAAWLQFIIHPRFGYKGDRHHVAAARKSSSILREMGVKGKDITKISDAIRAHRAKGVPYPERIEAKILFSANYMAGTEIKTLFGKVVEDMEEGWIKKKFILPEAGGRYERDKIERLKEKYEKGE